MQFHEFLELLVHHSCEDDISTISFPADPGPRVGWLVVSERVGYSDMAAMENDP